MTPMLWWMVIDSTIVTVGISATVAALTWADRKDRKELKK